MELEYFFLIPYPYFKKRPLFFFIRLLFFLISLTFMPQILFYYKITFSFINELETWGTISARLYAFHESEIFSYILTTIGLFIFFLSQNLLPNRIPSFNFKFKIKKNTPYTSQSIRKEPIIKNSNDSIDSNIELSVSNKMKSKLKMIFYLLP